MKQNVLKIKIIKSTRSMIIFHRVIFEAFVICLLFFCLATTKQENTHTHTTGVDYKIVLFLKKVFGFRKREGRETESDYFCFQNIFVFICNPEATRTQTREKKNPGKF